MIAAPIRTVVFKMVVGGVSRPWKMNPKSIRIIRTVGRGSNLTYTIHNPESEPIGGLIIITGDKFTQSTSNGSYVMFSRRVAFNPEFAEEYNFDSASWGPLKC